MELSNEKPYHNRTRRRVVCRRNDCERTERDANHESCAITEQHQQEQQLG
jgi:hypothetical protein